MSPFLIIIYCQFCNRLIRIREVNDWLSIIIDDHPNTGGTCCSVGPGFYWSLQLHQQPTVEGRYTVSIDGFSAGAILISDSHIAPSAWPQPPNAFLQKVLFEEAGSVDYSIIHSLWEFMQILLYSQGTCDALVKLYWVISDTCRNQLSPSSCYFDASVNLDPQEGQCKNCVNIWHLLMDSS